jgi:prepilin-type N-terminal cleavage/methylation domain-containing protein
MHKTLKNTQKNKGMTYVELIVVLSIFAVISAVSFYSYGAFQSNIDIKNLASDIALQIVQAQKSSVNGLWNSRVTAGDWKPSYGIYFNTSKEPDIDKIPFNTKFNYFADFSPQDGYFADTVCSSENGECLNKIIIAKGDFVSNIEICSGSDDACISGANKGITDIAITFKRPDSVANFYSEGSLLSVTGSNYIKISIESPSKTTGFIKIYPSGRIQVN